MSRNSTYDTDAIEHRFRQMELNMMQSIGMYTTVTSQLTMQLQQSFQQQSMYQNIIREMQHCTPAGIYGAQYLPQHPVGMHLPPPHQRFNQYTPTMTAGLMGHPIHTIPTGFPHMNPTGYLSGPTGHNIQSGQIPTHLPTGPMLFHAQSAPTPYHNQPNQPVNRQSYEPTVPVTRSHRPHEVHTRVHSERRGPEHTNIRVPPVHSEVGHTNSNIEFSASYSISNK